MDRPRGGHAGRRVTVLAAGGAGPVGSSGAAGAPGSLAGRLAALPAVAGALARCTFPPAGTPLTCAVSGGPDSLALLVLAVAAGCRVTAVHVDHRLREGSAAEAGLVADAARRLGAAFRSERVAVGAGPNLEARARQARFAVLPPDVATGHTMDDQAETVLVNLLRGTGVDGLGAMATGPEHPLLGLRRAEARRVCEAAGLGWLADPSNDDPAHLRNRVRHQLLPLCEAVGGRDPVPVLSRLAELCRDDAALLDELSARSVPDPADARTLSVVPLPLARRAVRRWLRASGATAPAGGRRPAPAPDGGLGAAPSGGPGAPGTGYHPPTAAEVARVLGVARGEAAGTEVAGGWRVRRTARRLRLEAPASPDGRRGGPGTG